MAERASRSWLTASAQTIVRDLWTLWLSRLDHRLRDPTKPVGLAADTGDEDEPATTSAEEADTERETAGDLDNHKKGKRTHESPQLVDTIALNFIGIILLRRPVSLARIFKYVSPSLLALFLCLSDKISPDGYNSKISHSSAPSGMSLRR